MKGNFKKFLIWFLIVIIAIGYNFAVRLPKDEKNQIIKITPQQNSFKVSENPKFTLEIEHSKSLRRFFRLVMLPWPIARAEEPVDFTEEVSLKNTCDSEGCHSDPALAGEESRGSVSDPRHGSAPEVLPVRSFADAQDDNLAQVVTSTDFFLETPNPQILGEIITSEATVTQTSTPLITPITPISPITLITTTSSTTDTSLIGQALEKVGEVIEQISQSAQEFLNEEKTIEVTVSNPSGEEVFETSLVSDQESLELELPKPEEDFQPGEWELEVKVKTEKLTLSQTLEFPWGVLAINTNKSIYLLGEEIYLQIAALDNLGHTLCHAKLRLEIKNPASETQTFSTETGTIEKNPDCGPISITNQPDYFTHYQVQGTGIYEMKLTNLDNGYEITDSFEVRESVPFEVERIGPTRIYPPASYEMTLRIKINQDFQGEVLEEVPESFEIKNQISNIKNTNQKSKIITWDVDWKSGESYELKYNFDAPDISPQLYLLGPLQLMETKFPTGNLVSLIFQEARSWQIAADEGFKVSMAIQVVDKDGARAKQGDIIAIKPAGWQWGTKEYEQFLIVEVDLGNEITTWEDAQKLTVPIFETGELWYPEEMPKVIGKRRYKIPFDDLNTKTTEIGITLDFSKIVDQEKKKNYQPLEKTTLSFDDLIQDKILNRKLTKNDLKIINDVGKDIKK